MILNYEMKNKLIKIKKTFKIIQDNYLNPKIKEMKYQILK